MPYTEVVYFAEEDGSVPMLEWLRDLPRQAQSKVRTRMRLLAEFGYELRRPLADTLREGVYELRVRYRNIQYRALYFFYQQQAVLSHGVTKKGKRVPDKEIDLAARRRRRFARSPEAHTYVL